MVTDLVLCQTDVSEPLAHTSIRFDHTKLFELSLTSLKIQANLLCTSGYPPRCPGSTHRNVLSLCYQMPISHDGAKEDWVPTSARIRESDPN